MAEEQKPNPDDKGENKPNLTESEIKHLNEKRRAQLDVSRFLVSTGVLEDQAEFLQTIIAYTEKQNKRMKGYSEAYRFQLQLETIRQKHQLAKETWLDRMDDINVLCFLAKTEAQLLIGEKVVCVPLKLPKLPPLRPGDDLSVTPVAPSAVPEGFFNYIPVCPSGLPKPSKQASDRVPQNLRKTVEDIKMLCASFMQARYDRIRAAVQNFFIK